MFLILASISRFLFFRFIPHETITCNDKDPPWMNKQIKTFVVEKNTHYKCLKRRMLNSKLFDKPDALQTKLQSSINFSQFESYRKISKNYLIHPVVLNAIEFS